jgi:regulator of replication initiation timing
MMESNNLPIVDASKVINRLSAKNAQLTAELTVNEVAVEQLQAENAQLKIDLETLRARVEES